MVTKEIACQWANRGIKMLKGIELALLVYFRELNGITRFYELIKHCSKADKKIAQDCAKYFENQFGKNLLLILMAMMKCLKLSH